MGYVIVFFGAGIGGALRHGVNQLTAAAFGLAFPVGTLFVNVAGSLLMAAIVEYSAIRASVPQDLRLFATTGILGGFTTFSTFSLDVASLYERGQVTASAVYALASLGLSLVAMFGGLWIARQVL